jgi:hypothetical protein
MSEIMGYGVCRLSVVPVRREARDQSEMITQLLFGDHYKVLDESNDHKWLQIRVYFDGYEGWIDQLQHKGIEKDYFDQINKLDLKISTEITAGILYKKKLVHIVLGSVLPISSTELFDLQEQFAFNGDSKNLGLKYHFEQMKQVALQYLHVPYLWGGKTPFGIDCSGFTQQVFRISGYKLKRDACEQFTQGEKVPDLDMANPGDLVFFKNKEGKINHVGILLEDSKIIHASGKVRLDFLDEKGIFNEELGKYTHDLIGLRRILSG